MRRERFHLISPWFHDEFPYEISITIPKQIKDEKRLGRKGKLTRTGDMALPGGTSGIPRIYQLRCQ